MLTRRTLIALAAAMPASGVRAQPFLPTPTQTEGPFYPVNYPADSDNDLIHVAGRNVTARGDVLLLGGRVMTRAGQPIDGAIVEIWQADANGRYDHPRAPGTRQFDRGFQGFGRTRADGQGYRFRTIRPVPYTGRAPHIHFAVQPPHGARLVTQMYVAGEPQNEWDGPLRSVRDPASRQSLIVPLERGVEGVLTARFDIVLDI